MKIELARSSDCIELADMSRRLIEYGLRWRWKPSRILALINAADCVVIVARSDTEVLGFAAMEFLDVHGHLSLLAVKPEARRLGLGHDLLIWLEQSAAVAGLDHISLEVRSNNASAIAFYEQHGYVIEKLRSRYYQSEEDAYQMIHQLISTDIAAKRP